MSSESDQTSPKSLPIPDLLLQPLSEQNELGLPEPTQKQLAILETIQALSEQPYQDHALYCKHSGVLLATVQIHFSEGKAPYLAQFKQSVLYHPFYGLHQTVLIRKLQDSLNQAHELEWLLPFPLQERMRLLVSAIMWNLEVMKQDRPCLPSYAVAAGSAARIINLAKWYWFVSSQRLSFPTYSVSSFHSNLEWQNIRWWIDSCFEIKKRWETKKNANAAKQEQLEADEETQEVSDALRRRMYKKIDVKKVWNWIEIQLRSNIPAGRIETFKELFTNGDTNSHEWLVDDCDDLLEAVVDCCDCGNDITHFINERMNGIAALIKDYYGGFSLISGNSKLSNSTDGVTKQEQSLLDEYDAQLVGLESLPPEPQRAQFPSNALFWKAQANWSILSKRWAIRNQRNLPQNPRPTDSDSIDSSDL